MVLDLMHVQMFHCKMVVRLVKNDNVRHWYGFIDAYW